MSAAIEIEWDASSNGDPAGGCARRSCSASSVLELFCSLQSMAAQPTRPVTLPFAAGPRPESLRRALGTLPTPHSAGGAAAACQRCSPASSRSAAWPPCCSQVRHSAHCSSSRQHRAGFAVQRNGMLPLCPRAGSVHFVDTGCTNLESLLQQQLVGQELALGQLTDAVCHHLSQRAPRKPLVISVHGPPGVGKTYTHLWMARALYSKAPSASLQCPGMHCRGYKVRQPCCCARCWRAACTPLPCQRPAAAVCDNITATAAVPAAAPAARWCMVLTTWCQRRPAG